MRIAILGAGAMGCMFGARLSLSGQDVTMIAHRQESAAILAGGIDLALDGQQYHAPVSSAVASDIHEAFDLIILFTKTMASRSALDSVRHLLPNEGDTVLLSLQNGLGNDRLLLEYTDADHAMVGVTNFPSDLIKTGTVVSHSTGYVKFMFADGKERPTAEKINQVFLHAGLNSSLEPSIMTAIWEKAGFNACQNAICGICNVPCGGIPKAPEGDDLSRRIIHETAITANAYGISVSEERMISTVEKSFRDYSDHYPSMAQDLQHGRKTEIGAINGQIIEYAHAKGLEVPYTETVYDLIRIIEANLKQD